MMMMVTLSLENSDLIKFIKYIKRKTFFHMAERIIFRTTTTN